MKESEFQQSLEAHLETGEDVWPVIFPCEYIQVDNRTTTGFDW